MSKRRPNNRSSIQGSADRIYFTDPKTKRTTHINRQDFEDRLVDLYKKISSVLPRIDKMGDYVLDEIGFSVGVSGGILVLTFEGGVQLTYRKPTGA